MSEKNRDGEKKGSKQKAPALHGGDGRPVDRNEREKQKRPSEKKRIRRGTFWSTLVGATAAICAGVYVRNQSLLQAEAYAPDIVVVESKTWIFDAQESMVMVFKFMNTGGSNAVNLTCKRRYLLSMADGQEASGVMDCRGPACEPVVLAPKTEKGMRTEVAEKDGGPYRHIIGGDVVFDLTHDCRWEDAKGRRMTYSTTCRYDVHQQSCTEIGSTSTGRPEPWFRW